MINFKFNIIHQKLHSMKTQRSSVLIFFLNMILIVCVAFRPGQETFEKIRVQEFELVDKNGKERASIKVESTGEIVFRMRDRTGTIRIKVGADEGGSGFVFLDGLTNTGIHGVIKNEGSTIAITGKDGKVREY